MADSIDNIDLTIFGGPTELDVSVDFGEQGPRGSRTWTGSGNPVTALVGQDIELYDWYLNTNTSDPYYSWLYQYVLEVGSPVWVPVLRLNPSQYSVISSTTFTAGSATVAIPVSNLTTVNGVNASNFIIRYNIVNANQIASGFTYSITGTYPNQNISIVIKAASWNGTTWSNLTGAQDVHFFISYTG
jgi:hypothetical protein